MAEVRFPVEAGHVMLFARAIGDPNPIYYDEEYARTTEVGHVIAPPTFTTAKAQYDPEYAMRPKPGQAWVGSGGTASGDSPQTSGEKKQGTGLHAEQHYIYHRHPQPGDILIATTRAGETWEKQGRRAGKLIFRETLTEFRDGAGELVITARGVSVRTERPVEVGR